MFEALINLRVGQIEISLGTLETPIRGGSASRVNHLLDVFSSPF